MSGDQLENCGGKSIHRYSQKNLDNAADARSFGALIASVRWFPDIAVENGVLCSLAVDPGHFPVVAAVAKPGWHHCISREQGLEDDS